MSTSDLKLDIIKHISASKDINLLKEIKNFFVLENKEEIVYVFNKWQQQKIDYAMKQLENGEYISDEQAQIETEKWFQEQEKLFGQ